MAEPSSMPTDYAAAISTLEKAIRSELAEHELHGISVALVDDQRIIYAAGFGDVKRDSIFRAGSVSKLFNAVAVMQLVEQGKLNLDAPIETYGPQFKMVVPFERAPPITLRQLLCHRSGMIRETPVGGYFDANQPSLAETVASIRSCVLVNPPNTKTRYSNVGPSIAGDILATVSGKDFAAYTQEHLFKPMGMTGSSFVLAGIPRERLANAFMRVADGHGGWIEQKAPLFDLGTIPAGNLFSTAEDLGRFVSMLAADGRAGNTQILSKATLDEMWTPQLIKEPIGFGLGFMVGKFQNHKTISHSGAVYGYSTSLTFLPESKLGVVLVSNDDIVNGNISRLSNLALSLMLEAKTGEAAPQQPAVMKLAADALQAFTGDFESPNTWAHFEVKNGELVGQLTGQSVHLLPTEPLKFMLDGRAFDRAVATFERDESGRIVSFTTAAGQKFARIDPTAAPEEAPLWKSYEGSYGPSFLPLVISFRNGHLYAMTENVADYRLTPVSRNIFAFPAGLYADEHLVFLTGLDGKVVGVNLANMTLPRH